MPINKSQNLLEIIQTKIAELLAEFQKGEISREQFNIVYQRYYKQVDLAYRVAIEDMKKNSSTPETVNIQDTKTNKVIGVTIYHLTSGRKIETLGNFNVSHDRVTAILDDLGKQKDDDSAVSKCEQLEDARWLLAMREHFTVAMIIFRNEPSQFQFDSLQRLLHDFEQANQNFLQESEFETGQLAQPFVAVVK